MKSPRTKDGRRGYLRWVIALAAISVCLTAMWGIWRWNANRQESQRQQLAAERAAAEQKRVAEAKRRIPEVNAKAKDLAANRQYDEALNALNEVLAVVDSPEILETKVDVLVSCNRGNQAYEVLLKLIQDRQQDPNLQVIAGNLALNLKGPKDAVPHYEAAAKLEPQNSDYQIYWAISFIRSGQKQAGLQILKRLIADDPNCFDCWYNYAESLWGTGDKDGALAVRRQAVERFPEDSLHHFWLAEILQAMGQTSGDSNKINEAVSEYRKSLELHPMPNSKAATRIYELTGKRVPPALELLAEDTLTLEGQGNSLFVRAKINGVDGRFVLDTGASTLSLYRSGSDKFNVRRTSRVTRAHTANGDIQAPIAYGDVELGKYKVPGIRILLMPDSTDHSNDGLFGLEALRAFNGEIDDEHRKLIVRGKPTP